MPEVKMHVCSVTSFSIHFCNIELWSDAPLVFKGDGQCGVMMQDEHERPIPRRSVRTPGKEVLDALFEGGFEKVTAMVTLRSIQCTVAAHELEKAIGAVSDKLKISSHELPVVV